MIHFVTRPLRIVGTGLEINNGEAPHIELSPHLEDLCLGEAKHPEVRVAKDQGALVPWSF